MSGSVEIIETFMKPNEEYPLGSYLRIIGDNVEIATGWFERYFPGHPSPYWHGGPPFFFLDTSPCDNWVRRKWMEQPVEGPKAIVKWEA